MTKYNTITKMHETGFDLTISSDDPIDIKALTIKYKPKLGRPRMMVDPWAFSEMLEDQNNKVTKTDLRVLMALWKYIKPNTPYVYASRKQILSELPGISSANFSTSIKRLAKAGAIIKDERDSYVINPAIALNGDPSQFHKNGWI